MYNVLCTVHCTLYTYLAVHVLRLTSDPLFLEFRYSTRAFYRNYQQ